MELDGLYVPARAPWLSDGKAELPSFPRGKHDDQVDALGLAGQLLDKWAPGGVPKIEPGGFRPRLLTTSHYTHGLTIRC
jgi:hypothetical protein